MEDKLKAILKILYDNTEGVEFTHIRDANKKRYVFIGEMGKNAQYILAIADLCLQDNSVERLQRATKKALPLIKDNPNKTVIIRSGLVIELE